MIDRFISFLHTSGFDLTAREIAEVLWLAPKIGAGNFDIEPLASIEVHSVREEPLPLEHKAGQEELSPDLSSIQPVSPPVPPTGAPATELGSFLHSDNTDQATNATAGGMSFRTPAASALPGKPAIARTLRPFRHRVPSRTDWVLDEMATVQRIAATNIWQPVLRPALTRWFDIALIIDTSAAMVIWHQTVAEFHHLLAHHGAFRDIRTWSMVTDADDEQVHLYAGTSLEVERHPRELVDPQGQRLFLIVSDCVSPAWYQGSVAQMLALWGQRSPVAIVQVLPQRLWTRSALGYTTAVQMHARSPGAPNRQFTHIPSPGQWVEEGSLDGIAVPVVTLEPQPLATWSRIVTGSQREWITGVVFTLSKHAGDVELEADATTDVSILPKKRVQRFRSTASPPARKLASYLAAAAPLNLPVMRLIQRTMLPEPRQVHLAEVFLGGLLQEISTENNTRDHENIHYDFITGVRDELLNSLAVDEALDVLSIVYEHIIMQTSGFIAERAGHPVDFFAWLATLTEMGTTRIVGEPFAMVSATVLRRLGGEFVTIADSLEQLMLSESGQELVLNESGKDTSQEIIPPAPLLADDLRILVVEDSPNWQEMVTHLLERLGNNIHVTVAPSYEVALQHIQNNTYDLAIVDLALLGTPVDPGDADHLGMDLLHALRNSPRNHSCGLIVLTAYLTTTRIRQIFLEYKGSDVMSKSEFDDSQFITAVRAALLETYLKRANDRASACYRLAVTMNAEYLIGSELAGPNYHSVYTAPTPIPFPVNDVTHRGATLETLFTQTHDRRGSDHWWQMAQATGEAIYQGLITEQRIFDLRVTRTLARHPYNFWLEFTSPPARLDIPFELLLDENDYLGLQHILTRRLVMPGAHPSHKPEPFHTFIAKLQERGETIRILIVADPANPSLPVATRPTPDGPTDIYTLFEIGMKHLLLRLSSTHPSYQEALIYEYRLMENLASTRSYGDTETNRAERVRIIAQVNRFATTALGVSFNALCQQPLDPAAITTTAPGQPHDPSPSVSAATVLAASLTAELERLGIANEVTVLAGADATFAHVRTMLHDGGYHLLHYVGAAGAPDTAPTTRGVVLHGDTGPHTLTPPELGRLVRNTELRMVFLSCGLNTATNAFATTLEALARADVPMIVGYRWGVSDQAANLLAQHFYRALWYCFHPGEALLTTRRALSMEAGGDSMTDWTAPVLVLQTMP